jgi:Flp pilus assembly protein TadG
MPLIAAGIGAAANIGTSYLAGQAQKKAAKKAADVARRQGAATSALAQANFNQNAALYNPYAASGMRAHNTLMDLILGPSAAAAPGAGGSALGAYGPTAAPTTEQKLANLMQNMNPKLRSKVLREGGTPEQQLATALRVASPMDRGLYDAYMRENQPSPYASPEAQNAPGSSALSAFDQFRNSTDYQWRLGEGQRGVNTAWAGDFESPAAALAMERYSGHMANEELGNWMNQLAKQEGIGINAAGSLAGFGNDMTQMQAGAGQTAADAGANAYGVAGQAAANTYGAVGQGIGQVAGAAFNPAPQIGANVSSYGGGGGYYGSGGLYGTDMAMPTTFANPYTPGSARI